MHKICALCVIFRAISVLLTTENSDDLEFRVPGSKLVKVTEFWEHCISRYAKTGIYCHFGIRVLITVKGSHIHNSVMRKLTGK